MSTRTFSKYVILMFLLPSIKPVGLTSAGRFLDYFSVARALDHRAVGAGSTQQGVHSHSDIFHQIKLGTVCPDSRPDSLPIQKRNHDIQITVYSSRLGMFTLLQLSAEMPFHRRLGFP